FSSITKTKSVSTIWAMRSTVICLDRDHEDTKTRRTHEDPLCTRRDLREASCLRVFVVPAPSVCSYGLPRAPVGRQRAAPFGDVRLVLVPEMLQRRQHRRDGRVAERAQRLAADVVRDAREQIEVAHLSFAALDAAQNLVQPVGSLAARRALAARLVAVEV